MPPTPTAKGKGKGLGKKLGPLPLWAWLAIAGVGGYFLYRRYSGGGGPGTSVETVTGASPQDMASAGQPSTNGAPASQLDPNTLQDLFNQAAAQGFNVGESKTQSDMQQLYAATTDQNNLLSQLLNGTGGTGEANGNGQGGANTPGSSGIDMSTLGVLWGGNIFRTKAGLATVLNANGVSYSQWAKRHPSAAQRLTGPLPAVHRAAPRPTVVHPKAHPAPHGKAATPKKKPPPKRAPVKRSVPYKGKAPTRRR